MSNVNNPQSDLIQSILSAAGNDAELASALLVGSTGESNQNPYASGSGGGGAFGFTPPNYPAYLETAPPQEQVAAILPSYQQAESQVPSSITDPAARAEWIALNAERPLNYDTEASQIASTNRPTTYGANTSYYAQNYQSVIVPELSGKYQNLPSTILTSSGYNITPAKGGYDPFTATMIKLNSAMQAQGISSLIVMPLTRGAFALGFGILGFLALTNIVTGGDIAGHDIPGVVAGFVGGAEIGLGRLGLSTGRRNRPETETSRRRLVLAESRFREQQTQNVQKASRNAERLQAQEENRKIAARRQALAPGRAQRAERRLRIEERREARMARFLGEEE